jgi:hypothetical protein
MTTRKELITKCYIEFLNEINDDDIKLLFPSLEDLDIADVVCFLEFFPDTTNIKETIMDVATLYGREINENKLNIVMPTIEKFLKKYIEIKKI